MCIQEKLVYDVGLRLLHRHPGRGAHWMECAHGHRRGLGDCAAGYMFTDDCRVGIPLSLLIGITAVGLAPLIRPF